MKKIGSCLWKLIEKIVVGCLRLLYTALHKELTEDVIDGFMQFVKFGVIGLSNTLLSYILNVIVLLILAPFSVSWDFFAGNIVGFVLSVL